MIQLCNCPDAKTCFHQPCIPRRRLRWGRQVIENLYGYIMLADQDDLVLCSDGSVFVRVGEKEQ